MIPKRVTTHFQRYEIKYWLTEERYFDVRDEIQRYMELDPYCHDRPHHAYPIWSLYLDTFDFATFEERLDGLIFRQKYRLRTYGADKPFEDALTDPLFVEIKKKQNKVILKDRSLIKVREALDLLDHASGNPFMQTLPLAQKKTMERFVFFQNHLSLGPQIAVKYEREAYFGENDRNVRVTFDRNLCAKESRALAEMYTETKNWFHHRNPQIIFEIKVYDAMPQWLVNILRRFQLRSEPISKYCESVEMVFPRFSLSQ